MPQELEKRVNAVPPHPRRHLIFRCKPTQSRVGRRVLACQEKVVMLMQKASVKANELLPLFGIEILFGTYTGGLNAVQLYTLVLYQNKATVYTFDF